MPSKNKSLIITAFDFFPQTGGVATYAWELAESLGRQGFQVLVVARHHPGPIPKPEHFDIEYLQLPSSGLLSVPFMALKLKTIFLRYQPDKVIATLWAPGAIASLFARWLCGGHTKSLDVATVVHAMEVIDPKKGWKGWLRRRLRFLKVWTFKSCKGIFCVSQYTKNLVHQETGVSLDKITVVNNGVNLKKFMEASPLSSATELFEAHFPLLLTLARLVPHKGIDRALEALPPLIQKFPKTKYLIGGTGPDRRRLEALVDTLGIRASVEFLGYVPDEDLAELYGVADLLILLSREERPFVEGFGLVFLEAAACGTPSLGGRSGGIPDAILEEKTGWLVEPNDVPAISERLIQLASQPQDLESMGQRAKAYTEEFRSWDQVSETLSKHLFGEQ